MADDNIKDFTLTWVLSGVLVFSLISFALIFVYNNNSSALGENEDQLNLISGNLSSSLTEIEGKMDSEINGSAQLSSDETTLASISSSSPAYSLYGEGQNTWTNLKIMMAWIFAGSFGQLVIRILGGIIGMVGLYYVIKLIRSLF